MVTVEDVLSADRVRKYHDEWDSFQGRYKPETEYHTHSGRPVISQIFRFEEERIFRAHVFGEKRLREIDPYFLFRKYPHKHWHIAHYLAVTEQMYHASMRLVRDTNLTHTLDVPKEIKLSTPISWRDNISVEFIWQPTRQTPKYSIEDCYFTFYDDMKSQVKGRSHAMTFVQPRDHVTSIKRLKEGDKEALEVLVRQIEGQARKHGRLLTPRTDLPSKEYLIDQLKSGNIPEEELHDYFSLWDKEAEL